VVKRSDDGPHMAYGEKDRRLLAPFVRPLPVQAIPREPGAANEPVRVSGRENAARSRRRNAPSLVHHRLRLRIYNSVRD
jgi:hypothetical protein